MKRLMKVETNASTMFVTYDEEEKIARILDNIETNTGFDIRNVEDDSSWEMYEDVENIEDFLNPDDEIVDEIEIEF